MLACERFCTASRCLGPPAEARPTAMQLLEDEFFSRRLPPPEQHRRPIAAQIAEREAEERSSRSLAAHDSGSSEGDNEAQRCEVQNLAPIRGLEGTQCSSV